jgi:crossover junction endodeoxyribonuclease RuvC
MTPILGIDPGSSGAWVYFTEGASAWGVLPFNGKEFNAVAFARSVSKCHIDTIAVVEFGQAFQKSSKASMFKQGQTYGTIIGVLAALKLRYELVQSRAWKAAILAGYTDKDKTAAIAYVTRAFPQLDLTGGGRHKPHDGLADAACIAEYGRRTYAHGTTSPAG